MKNMKEIEHIDNANSIDDLVRKMGKTSFNGKALSKAVDVLEEMINDKDCKMFFGQAGAMVPGGMKQIIHDFVKWSDVFVCTGATLTHDLIEGLGHRHYQLNVKISDKELNEKGYDRIYDSLMPNIVYEDLEKFVWKCLDKLDGKGISITDFLRIMGEKAPENTILNIAFKNNTPVFCPALSDSGIGLMIWGWEKDKNKKANILAFEDLDQIISISWDAKKKGVFYVGGGVPKNYIQQSMQFSNPADYNVQITVDDASFGGSSGAVPEEGVSWGKLKEEGKFVNVICDATIALPLIHSALKNRI